MRKVSSLPKNINRAGKYVLVIFTLITVVFSCKKETEKQPADSSSQKPGTANVNAAIVIPSTYCREDAEDGLAYDSILKPTILGARLIGFPYSVATMTQASINLTRSSIGVAENAWYVRFKPTTPDQLAVLEDLDIDLFDYPLDYELVQEGDYYNDGVTPAETIPWLYAVVTNNFIPPAGITYELLQRLYVPDDYRLENEAFRITGNIVDTAGCGGGAARVIVPNVRQCDCIEPIPIQCEGQCGFTGGGGVPLPPLSAARVPAGSITVTDDVPNPHLVPVRKARVVARRFLKVDRVFTDNNGNYRFTKSFRNKVTLLLKFKNGDAIIKGLRGARLWQILMPVKINMGRYRGDVSNIPYNVEDNNEVRSRGARHWAAATTHNAVQEYILDRAPVEGVGIPPAKLRILVVPGNGGGSTPMFAKRFISNLPEYFIRQYLLSKIYYPLTYINSLATLLASRVDMTIGYNRGGLGVTTGNDGMAELCYHELTHAAHYNKIGNVAYGNFVQAEINEIINSFNGNASPYGTGTNANSPIIALGESWAYHMGHFLTNRKYGTLSGQFNEQQQPYLNDFPVIGLNSNLNLLEDFSPTRTIDPFRWIPQGLYYDMIDLRNETGVPVIDGVSNYTNQQFFNALDNDITNLQLYRQRLLNENGNNQSIQVTNLFGQYGY
jgi:hypothetical protein